MKIFLMISLLACLLSITKGYSANNNEFNKTMDGVPIEAIEIYPNLDNQEYTFGITMFPFNPYYNGLGCSSSFSYYFSKTWAWEILSGSYIFSVDKNLVSELADKYSVSPKDIEKLRYVITSNFRYVHSFGKTIFLEQYIQSYKSTFLFGVGNVTTSFHSKIALHFGIHFDFYISEKYSWKIEISDLMTIPDGSFDDFNFISLKVLTGVRF